MSELKTVTVKDVMEALNCSERTAKRFRRRWRKQLGKQADEPITEGDLNHITSGLYLSRQPFTLV